MSNSELEMLMKKYHEQILLAEVAAWLHDWQKCIDMAVASHWSKKSSMSHEKIRRWRERGKILKPGDFSQLIEAFQLNDGPNNINMKLLCEKGRNPSEAENHPNSLVKLLGACHDIAHVEKELEENEAADQATDWIAQAFGYEDIQPRQLLKPLLQTVGPHLRRRTIPDRKSFLNDLHTVFSRAWGDTRRPVNEVTLWDWSSAVASLYKSEQARCFLTGVRRARNLLCWRLLRVNFDVLGLYTKAIKIADVLGYKERIDQVCEKVSQLIEEEYPFGNEVYRDNTGIYFTFPDLDDLLPDLECEIRQQIEGIEPELVPRIAVGEPHGPAAAAPLKHLLADGRKEARKALAQPFETENLNPCWQSLWDNLPSSKWEVCSICRLRPMKEHSEACETCKGRRKSRVKEWKDNPSQTIWMDEIADHNNRVALIVGKFGLDNWLSGDLVQTMLVRADPKKGRFVPKNPSPARLRRVWETCQRFWTETVEHNILAGYSYGTWSNSLVFRTVRLTLEPQEKKDWRENIPYDGTLNGQPLSLLWEQSQGHFITIINLQLAAGEAKSIGQLRQSWQGCIVEGHNPENPRQRWRFTIRTVERIKGALSTYRPALTLLTSPDQFLAFVPASEALELGEKIHREYQEQFGKVQDRLPLFLGLIFFQRKTPLMAVMDTARRMLSIPLDSEQWTVKDVDKENPSAEGWPETVKVRLEKDGQKICFKIKTVMGDDTTKDIWYPYFFFNGDPGSYSHRFQLDGHWLVHVNDLNAGDPVRVTLSRFAYLFLESTARRFGFDSVKNVMLLDELPRLLKMWEDLRQSPEMTQTKLQAIQALFSTKRQLWRLEETEAPDSAERKETFRQLVETTLNRDKVRGVTVEDITKGLFDHCLQLHLHILKRKVKGGNHEQQLETI